MARAPSFRREADPTTLSAHCAAREGARSMASPVAEPAWPGQQQAVQKQQKQNREFLGAPRPFGEVCHWFRIAAPRILSVL